MRSDGSHDRLPLTDARGIRPAMKGDMRVLVTGGSGVIGQAVLASLTQAGHEVRLFSRHASRHAREWPEGVEPWPGDVADAASVRGSADGCDAILHVAGIVEERPPTVTFSAVNVDGTRNIIAEADRAGVKRLVYVSSLGAERGESAYHRSKLEAEGLVRSMAPSRWTIVRPGNVYGPGDEVISVLLTMVRTLPAVPVIDGGDQRFQPVWADDVGDALVSALERGDLAGRTLEIAGPDTTSVNDVLDRLMKLTDREPSRIPVPGFLASLGAKIAGWMGADLPINDDKLTMLAEENVVRSPDGNSLRSLLDREPTSLTDGLRKLADALPEQLPAEGVGSLKRKRFWAEIEGSRLSPEALFEHVRTNFSTLTPWHLEVGAEPGTPTVLDEGETLTMQLPARGHIQVRCAELTDRRLTLVTLAGHPLAGAVRMLTEPRGDRVRFEIQVYDRAAGVVDWLGLRAFGDILQNRTWIQTVENVVKESGGRADDVKHESDTLDDDEAERINEWIAGMVAKQKRAERAGDQDERFMAQ